MSKYSLLSVMGLEIEYMLVDKATLQVAPLSDEILKSLAGQLINEVSLGDISVSNELVLHVIELKNSTPQPQSFDFNKAFTDALVQLSTHLDKKGIMLLPTAAHPFMNPDLETKRWPHGQNEIYSAYDAIFDCKGHGWSNLQSVHVNLPFANDNEFVILHNSLRVLLPLLPALSASSPYIGGKATGFLDNRLVFYGQNQQKIPEITGAVIPEWIHSIDDYHQRILAPMYNAIAPFDREGTLQEPWLNSRGIIPKFDIGAIEIRILDSQECVKADVAIATLIHALLKSRLKERPDDFNQEVALSPLVDVYESAIEIGFATKVSHKALLKYWSLPQHEMNLKTIWSLLIEKVSADLSFDSQKALEHILSRGALSQRLLQKGGVTPSNEVLIDIYHETANCLNENKLLGE